MEKMIQTGVRILEPVLIHFFAINIVQMMRLHADAAFLTTITAILVLPVFLIMMKRDGYFQKKRKKLRIGDMVWIVLLAAGSNICLTFMLNLVRKGISFDNSAQEALFQSQFLIQIIGIGMIVPIMEEVLFRGLVYQRLKDYNKGWSSVILAAGIFAVYHGNAIQILFAFPMALLILAVYEKWDTLLAPVMFHMTVNISSILITTFVAAL